MPTHATDAAAEPWTKTLIVPVASVSEEAAQAHALENCRAVVRAAARFLQVDQPSPASRERAERFRRAAGALDARVGSAVRFGELRADSEPVEVEAEAVLVDVCDRARDVADAKGVSLVVYAATKRVSIRRYAFAEALFNLVVNAIDATKPGFPVFASVSTTADGNTLWEIEDHGEGMTLSVLRWLGEPFRSTRPLGMGLGIPIARAIIEEHGGILGFESAPGVGTTARAWTPLRA